MNLLKSEWRLKLIGIFWVLKFVNEDDEDNEDNEDKRESDIESVVKNEALIQ